MRQRRGLVNCHKVQQLLLSRLSNLAVSVPDLSLKMVLFMNACALLVKVLTLPLHIAEVIGLLSFYKRVFPLIVYKISFSYNVKMNDNKRELFRNLDKFSPPKGSLRILELGCGSGANFEHYPTGCRITCIDPNPHFQKYLEKSMAKNDHLVYDSFVVASGENLRAVEDNSMDVVVCTLVLCSVQDTQKVLREAKRVLRPVSLGQSVLRWWKSNILMVFHKRSLIIKEISIAKLHVDRHLLR